MSEEDDGSRLQALVKAVSDDLWVAAATFEVYGPTAFDASLIEKVNEREVYPAFAALRSSWRRRLRPTHPKLESRLPSQLTARDPAPR